MLGVFDSIQCSFLGGLNSRQKRNSNKAKFENRCSLITHMQVNGCEMTEKRQITRLLCMKKKKTEFSVNTERSTKFPEKPYNLNRFCLKIRASKNNILSV